MSSRPGELDFDAFKRLARDSAASLHEKAGFPDSYREGKEAAILRDVERKLTNLRRRRRRVADIGPGCGVLARSFLARCGRRGHELFLVDSAEVLGELPAPPFVTKVAGRFPDDCVDFIAQQAGAMDTVLAYSLLHYVFAERDVFAFLDKAIQLLAPGGQLLIGDIPNQSMRGRFFASAAGVRFHHRFTGRREAPPVVTDRAEPGVIDDAVAIALTMRARAAGCHAWLVPQAPDLPMANRREDLLVVRP